MAARSHINTKFFLLPCCKWEFDRRYAHRGPAASRNENYLYDGQVSMYIVVGGVGVAVVVVVVVVAAAVFPAVAVLVVSF